jgi:hypothetical protein
MLLVTVALTLAIGIAVLFGLDVSRLNQLPGTALGIAFGFVWMLLEGTLLTTTGGTPGKALYGLRVVTLGGERPPFGKALRRSLGVYVFGLAFCAPLLVTIAMLANFWNLSKRGTTPWDRASDCQERRRPIDLRRMMVAVFVTFVLMVTFVLLWIVGEKQVRGPETAVSNIAGHHLLLSRPSVNHDIPLPLAPKPAGT